MRQDEGDKIAIVTRRGHGDFFRCLGRAALFLLVTLIAAAPASGQTFETKGLQPLSPYGVFSTFSAESLRQNKVGLALGIERSVEPTFWRTIAQLAYGLHDRFEINVTLPYVTDWEHNVDGFEDAYFGVKHRILDEGK